MLKRNRHKIDRVVVDATQVPAEFSGVGRQLAAIGHDLQASALRCRLVLRCPGDVVPLLAPAFPRGTEVQTPLPRSRPRWRRILRQQVIAPLRDGRGTLVLCAGDQAPLWGRARVALVVHDIRRLTHPETAPRAERLFYRAIQPPSIRRADVLLTVSRFSAAEIESRIGPTSPVVVVAHHPPPVVDEPNGAGADSRYLLVVGALRPYKGVEDVIDALAQIDPRHVERVVFAGSADGREPVLSAHARTRGVEERVEFRGWVGEQELEDLYAGALASVCPSHYEGYGLPLAESLARGLPAIASRIPPHVEVAESAASWFEPGDAHELAAAVVRLAEDPLSRADLAQLALDRSRALTGSGPTWGEALAQAVTLASADDELPARPDASLASRP